MLPTTLHISPTKYKPNLSPNTKLIIWHLAQYLNRFFIKYASKLSTNHSFNHLPKMSANTKYNYVKITFYSNKKEHKFDFKGLDICSYWPGSNWTTIWKRVEGISLKFNCIKIWDWAITPNTLLTPPSEARRGYTKS